MTVISDIDEEEAHPALEPWLEFLRLCIEDPVRAARRVAFRLSIAASVIMAAALLAGTTLGFGVALIYVASSWGVLLLVHLVTHRGDDA